MSDDFVDDGEILYRRIAASRNLYKIKDDGTIEIYSTAFGDRDFKISVDRAQKCDDNPRYTMGNELGIVACLVVEQIRNIDDLTRNETKDDLQLFKIDVKPVPLSHNLAHAEIYAIPGIEKRSAFHRLCRRLARLAEMGQWIDLSQS